MSGIMRKPACAWGRLGVIGRGRELPPRCRGCLLTPARANSSRRDGPRLRACYSRSQIAPYELSQARSAQVDVVRMRPQDSPGSFGSLLAQFS